MRVSRATWTLSIMLAASCSQRSEPVTRTIGPQGGKVEISGATLVVPAGALDREVDVTLSRTSDAAPAGYAAQSPLFSLEPSGLTFLSAAELTLDFTGGTDGLAVFLSAAAGGGYERLAGTVSGQHITAGITHFSTTFAGSQSAGTGPIALPDLGTAMDEARCHVMALCGMFPDAPGCVRFVQDYGDGMSFAAEQRAVAEGRQAYDGAAARRCLDKVTALTACPQDDQNPLLVDTDCRDKLKGLVATGAPCSQRGDCARTDTCPASTSSCPASCTPRVAEGQTVAAGQECAEGLYAYGQLQVCRSKVALGASCAPAAPNNGRQTCVEGSSCDALDLLCKRREDVGGVCAGAEDCLAGLKCFKTVSGDGGVSIQGVCSRALTAGGTCNPKLGTNCQLPLNCVPTAWPNGTCTVRGTAGAGCTADSSCTPDLWCDRSVPDAGACAAKLGAGSPCSGLTACAPGNFCGSSDAGTTCQARKTEGQACNGVAWECQASLWCPAGTSRTCQPSPCKVP